MNHLRTYQTIDSTNLEAARLLASGEAFHGLTILAHHQTDGRGQHGRNWHAEARTHLAMSIILLPPDMPVDVLPLLSMKTSLAIAKTIASIDHTLHPKIKWPNDIYLNDQKLAGILIENSLQSGKIQHSIIGIGLNVNETSFPSSVPNAVSLRIITGKDHEVNSLAERIRDHVMNIMDNATSNWKQQYDSLIYHQDMESTFEINGKIQTAVISGVDPEGKLMLHDEHGKTKSYFSHELKWIV